MANYYYVTIKSDKITQNVANEILQTIAPKNRIRNFHFVEGELNYNTRGLTDITDILNAYGFIDEEIEIKDEFDLVAEGNTMTLSEAIDEENIKYNKIIKHYISILGSTDEFMEAINKIVYYQDKITNIVHSIEKEKEEKWKKELAEIKNTQKAENFDF